jgi:hypothetical protein
MQVDVQPLFFGKEHRSIDRLTHTLPILTINFTTSNRILIYFVQHPSLKIQPINNIF